MNHVKTIIKAFPDFQKEIPTGEPYLEVAEFFFDTIQGENFIGYPAAFLRVQHCTQNCDWCDTFEVWRKGNPYTIPELLDLMETSGLIDKLIAGQHLVLTGGSPVKQQKGLIALFKAFQEKYLFLPFLEIENECTLMPDSDLIRIISVWNNSPKLSNSGNIDILRYQPPILRTLAGLENAWFKFVISSEEDWDEIEEWFLKPALIERRQIVLMPLGATRQELHENREKVVEIAIRESVRYSSREHVELWDKKTGV